MIINYNRSFNENSQEEIENIHRIKFNEKKFEKYFSKIKDTKWIDRLILIYKYNEQRIILKTAEKNI